MVEALGVDSRKVLFGVFGAGAALAAVAGVLGGQIYGARPGLDENVLILAQASMASSCGAHSPDGFASTPTVAVGSSVSGRIARAWFQAAAARFLRWSQ